MFRLSGALLASFALMAFSSSAAGSEYQDPRGRFSVDVPTNWMAHKTDAPQIAAIMIGASGKELIGICMVSVTEVPDTKSTSQGEIDDAMGQVFTPAFWKMSLQAAGARNVVIESTSVREHGGRKIHAVVMSMSEKGKDGPQAMKAKQEVHTVPGAMHVIACATPPERYDTALADFDSILLSYRPMNGLISQAPSGARSVLTLYAKPNFEGAARVLSQDAANLAALGLGSPPASVAVAGFGQWEVCEGANFTGNCRLLAAVETSARGQGLRLGSVRRKPGNDPRGTAGVASTAAGIAIKAAAQRVVQGR